MDLTLSLKAFASASQHSRFNILDSLSFSIKMTIFNKKVIDIISPPSLRAQSFDLTNLEALTSRKHRVSWRASIEFQDYDPLVPRLRYSHQDFHKRPQGILLCSWYSESPAWRLLLPWASRKNHFLKPFDTVSFVTSQSLITHPHV